MIVLTPQGFLLGDQAPEVARRTRIVSRLRRWQDIVEVSEKLARFYDGWSQRVSAESPLFKADQIKVPLLIGQGANDPRVNKAESDQIVAAMRKNGKDIQYYVFPDEGHGFARPENQIDFYGRVEEFLAKHLGGRAEPWKKIAGATAEVR